MSTFNLTKNWILSSGLVVTNSNDENLGGVHSFYDEKKDEYGFLYPEITGYFTSALRFLHSIDNNSQYIVLAKNSSDWLMNIEQKFGGIIQGINKDNSIEKLVYSFDTGICATGILDCYQLTHEEKYLKFAQKLADWISDEALQDNGFIQAGKELNTNNFFEEKKLWYKQSGCFHLKTAIPFLKLYEITNDESKLSIAKKILQQYTSYKNNDGSISLHANNLIIHIHSLCYALEGLLYGYHVTKDETYLKNCELALNWCKLKIEKDGVIHLWFNSSYQQVKTSYHVAQLVRLMILYDKAKEKEIFRKTVESLFKFMMNLQNTDGSGKIKGGFYEEFYKSLFGWKKRYRVNSWASLFALQAIHWKENYETLSFQESISYLF